MKVKIIVVLALMVLLSASVFVYADESKYSVVTVPCAKLLADDDTLDDEALYGLAARVILSGDSALIEMPYGLTRVNPANIQVAESKDIEAWKNSITHQIIAPFADIQSEAMTQSYPLVITLPRGAYIKAGEVNHDDPRYIQAELFGGIKGWVRRPLVRPIRRWNIYGEEVTRKNLVDDAKLYLGTSYRWGGRTPEGVDCSGLTHVVYKLNGLEIFRNSRPKTGFPIALKHVPGNSEGFHTLETLESVKPGDLIHWSGHVGMYIGDGKFIHANGTDFGTVISSLISSDENYREDLARPEAINTFGTAFPDEPEKLTVKEFYARDFMPESESGDKKGYRFYVRAEGYAPNKAIIYPEGISHKDNFIALSDDLDVFRFVYSTRDSQKAPEYFYTKPGKYRPAVQLINDEGYRPSGKAIVSEVFEMPEFIVIE